MCIRDRFFIHLIERAKGTFLQITMKFKYHKQYRLPEFDYSSNNGYFITIVTKDRQHFFGEIINQEMFITEIGLFVENHFKKIENEILHLKIHEYVIMPNHIHFLSLIHI